MVVGEPATRHEQLYVTPVQRMSALAGPCRRQNCDGRLTVRRGTVASFALFVLIGGIGVALAVRPQVTLAGGPDVVVTGQPGPPGASGSPGQQGAPGRQGPQGPAGKSEGTDVVVLVGTVLTLVSVLVAAYAARKAARSS